MNDPIYPYMVQFYTKDFNLLEDITGRDGTIFVPARSPEEAAGKALLGLGSISDDMDQGELCPIYTKVELVEFTLREDDSKYQIRLEEKVQEESPADSEG